MAHQNGVTSQDMSSHASNTLPDAASGQVSLALPAPEMHSTANMFEVACQAAKAAAAKLNQLAALGQPAALEVQDTFRYVAFCHAYCGGIK